MRIEGNRDRHVAVVVYVTVMLICVGLPVCLVTRATTSLKIFVGRVGATLFLCVCNNGGKKLPPEKTDIFIFWWRPTFRNKLI